jgi:hypothetical protein
MGSSNSLESLQTSQNFIIIILHTMIGVGKSLNDVLNECNELRVKILIEGDGFNTVSHAADSKVGHKRRK